MNKPFDQRQPEDEVSFDGDGTFDDAMAEQEAFIAYWNRLTPEQQAIERAEAEKRLADHPEYKAA